MGRVMHINSVIELTNSENKLRFEIIELLGVGGSCMDYKVKYYENRNIPYVGILKEYCPAFLDNGTFSRERTSLNIPEGMQEKFLQGLEDFRYTYKSINEYLSNNLTASNYEVTQKKLDKVF